MKRLLLVPFLLLLFPGCDPSLLAQRSQAPVSIAQEPTLAPPIASSVDPSVIHYEEYLRATCRLVGGGSGGSGTCFRIDDQYVYVLTCRHVVGKAKKFQVEFWLNGRITGKYNGMVSRVLDVDAAVICISVGDFKEGELPLAIPISPTAPILDSKVIVSIGSRKLRWQVLFEGQITGLQSQVWKGVESFSFVPAPSGGQSGAGIIQDGKIVGILWGTTDHSGKKADGRGYAVNARDFQSLIVTENLFFTAKWCQFCTQMKPVIQELKESDYSVRIVDYDLNKALAKLHGITRLPSYVNYDGEVIFGLKEIEDLSEFYDLAPPPAPESEPELEIVPSGDEPEFRKIPPSYRKPSLKPRRSWRLFR